MHLVIKTAAVERILTREFIALLNIHGIQLPLTETLKENGPIFQFEIKTGDCPAGSTTPKFITITDD